eukprot:TRINITY_DN15188_c0_g1_i2.p2 TRINITY_DN15188_c0_g1~~TRINITY_DN15188_c0_g1_i2.p2  ORF type:complete len:105 (-),score=15.69 TRINITY_DN15188_c0_g1_i2:107-421(-)
MENLKDEKELFALSKTHEPKPDDAALDAAAKKSKSKYAWLNDLRSPKHPSFEQWVKATKDQKAKQEKELKKLKEAAIAAKKNGFMNKKLASRLDLKSPRKRSNT